MRVVAGEFPESLAAIEAALLDGAEFVPLLAPYLQANVYFQLYLTTTYGELAPALKEAATLLRLMATQRQRLRQLLAYPLGLFISMAGLFVTLRIGILPQLQGTLTTTTVPHEIGWQRYGWLGGGLIGALLLFRLWRWWLGQSSLRLASLYLQMPVVGRIWQAYYAYYLTANLSQLVRSGLSVKQMFGVLRQLPQRALLRQLAMRLEAQLTVGQSPVKWLRRQEFIPYQLLVFLQKGSPEDKLTRELKAYSDLQYRELVRRLSRGLALVQPVLLGIVAILIVGAYLSLLLPMYQNLQGVYNG